MTARDWLSIESAPSVACSDWMHKNFRPLLGRSVVQCPLCGVWLTTCYYTGIAPTIRQPLPEPPAD